MKFRDKPLEDWEEVVIRLHQEQKLGFREIGRQLGVSRAAPRKYIMRPRTG